MRLIDADKLLQHTKFYNLKNGNRAIDEIDIVHAPTVQAISIPKNATNGDVFMLMFPGAEVTEVRGHFDKKTLLGYRTWLGGRSQDFLADWWDALYKKAVEE